MAAVGQVANTLAVEPTFSGNANDRSHIRDPRQFLSAFEKKRHAFPVEANFISRLSEGLRGEAAEWVDKGPRLKCANSPIDWERMLVEYAYFKRQFLLRFQPELQQCLQIQDYTDVKQTTHESSQQYLLNMATAMYEQHEAAFQQVHQADANFEMAPFVAMFINNPTLVLEQDRNHVINVVTAWRDAAQHLVANPQAQAQNLPLTQNTMLGLLGLCKAVAQRAFQQAIDRIVYDQASLTWAKTMRSDRTRKFVQKQRFECNYDIHALISQIVKFELVDLGPVLTNKERAAKLGARATISNVNDYNDPQQQQQEGYYDTDGNYVSAAFGGGRGRGRGRGRGGRGGQGRPPFQRLRPDEIKKDGCIFCLLNSHKTNECNQLMAARANAHSGGSSGASDQTGGGKSGKSGKGGKGKNKTSSVQSGNDQQDDPDAAPQTTSTLFASGF